MRKGKNRVLLGVLAGLSLALCLGAGALWMRSTAAMDQVRTADPYHQTTFVSANGEFCVETVRMAVPDMDPGFSLAHALPTQYFPRVVHWQFAGFGGGRETMSTLEGPVQFDTLMVPMWPVVVVLAIPPVLYWDGRRLTATPAPAEASPAF